MKDDFDAYYTWLSIPPSEQPPHHYRLLGLKTYEANRDVIERAADRQSGHLKTYQTGPRGALSQRLLSEVAAAAACLLDPGKKSAYDQQLAKEIDALPVMQAVSSEPSFPDLKIAVASPIARAKPIPAAQSAKTAKPPAKPAGRPILETIKIVGGGLLGVILGLLVVSRLGLWNWSEKSHQDETKATAKNGEKDPSKPPAKPAPASEKEATADASASNNAHAADSGDTAASTSDVAAAKPAPAVTTPPSESTSPTVPPVASLSSILDDPSAWRFRDSTEPAMGAQGLEIRADEKPNFMVTKKDDYRNVIVKIELAAGKGTDAYLILGAQQADEFWSGITSHINDDGASILSGHQFQNFDTIEKGLGRANIPYDVLQTIELKMNNNECWIKVNGVARSGVLYGRGRLENRIGAVGLIVNSGSVTINRVEITPLPGPDVAAASPAPTDDVKPGLLVKGSVFRGTFRSWDATRGPGQAEYRAIWRLTITDSANGGFSGEWQWGQGGDSVTLVEGTVGEKGAFAVRFVRNLKGSDASAQGGIGEGTISPFGDISVRYVRNSGSQNGEILGKKEATAPPMDDKQLRLAKALEPLESQIENYKKRVRDANDGMLKAFDQAEKVVRNSKTLKSGDQLALLNRLKEEKAAFNDHEYMPFSVQMREAWEPYLNIKKMAKGKLENAFNQQIKGHLNSDDKETATLLQEELNRLLARKIVARWMVDTQWTLWSDWSAYSAPPHERVGTWKMIGNAFTVQWPPYRGKIPVDTCELDYMGNHFDGTNYVGGKFAGEWLAP